MGTILNPDPPQGMGGWGVGGGGGGGGVLLNIKAQGT